MMRVFRRTSPMSVGSWILGTAAPASAAAALFETRSNGLPSILGRATGLVSGLLGAPLAGYTGVLIANTAVPIWQAGRRSLPGLFMASGVSSAGSLLQLTGGGDAERQTARLFAAAGQAGELVGGAAFEREAGGVATVAKPLHEGLSGTLWKATKALTASALALNVVPGRSRLKGLAAGALGTLGALSLRFAVFHAGKSSARDPRATFDNQRSGRGAAEVTGTAAVTGAGGRRAT
jgi:formate-dependent nitrite reductase membrane component NrfD